MTKEDIVALAATYSAVIIMDEDTRRRHLASDGDATSTPTSRSRE